MPNTKPYNKEEVMKEAHLEALGFSKNAKDCADMTVLPVGYIGRLLGKYLTLAEQAGEERMREKVKEIIPLEQERTLSNFTPPEYYDGFNRCREVMRLNLEALK